MRKRLLFATLSAALGVSCTSEPSPEAGSPRASAWRLVESEGLLVLEPFDPSSRLRIEIRFSREDASVGELVEAELRIPGGEGVQRIEVIPDGPGVTLLGPSTLRLEGSQPGKIRFTRTSPGRGGISVVVR